MAPARVVALLALLVPRSLEVELPGDACLPRDVINFLNGDTVLNAGKACRAAVREGECSSKVPPAFGGVAKVPIRC